MTRSDSDPSPRRNQPALRSVEKSELLSLLASDEAAPAARMRDALDASRETSLRLARGAPAALVRTYAARLSDAQAHGVPTVGIQALLDALAEHHHDHVWGFTVRDDTMIYIGFADGELSRLVGVVIIARRGAELLMVG